MTSATLSTVCMDHRQPYPASTRSKTVVAASCNHELCLRPHYAGHPGSTCSHCASVCNPHDWYITSEVEATRDVSDDVAAPTPVAETISQVLASEVVATKADVSDEQLVATPTPAPVAEEPPATPSKAKRTLRRRIKSWFKKITSRIWGNK